MKTKYAAGLLAAIALLTSSSRLAAQVTNFVAYNFDTDQVTTTPYGTAWGSWFTTIESVTWDPTEDANNNPSSGSMELMITNSGFNQYLLFDSYTPTYGPLDLQVFTNLSFDMRYDVSSAIRTNTAGAGVNGSQGVGSLDFGYMRVGSKSNPGFGQDWYYPFAIPATNGLGNPNTNWIHVSIPLATTAGTSADLLANGIPDTMFGMDNNGFNAGLLYGQQIIHFDNIVYSGFLAPTPPPTMSIKKTTPALRMFGGSGQYGRSQVVLVDQNESWIGGPYPISYSMTLLNNATAFAAPVDTHIQIISPADTGSQSDYVNANTFWLQLISTSSNAVTAAIQWKTNTTGANPANTLLRITNAVRAGKWTLTFLSDTNGTLTAPGTTAIPWSVNFTDPNDVANWQTAFANPVSVRFGLENNGAPLNGGTPDDWASISVSGTVGLSGTNYTENFTEEGTNQLDTTFWSLGANDPTGPGNQVLVPTNAPYWVTWSTPDNGFVMTTSTNIHGSFSSWILPEFYNSYSDGSNTVGTQVTQAKQRWNLMLPTYLPTANGAQGTNDYTVGGPPSPKAYFRLQTNPPPM